MVHYNQLDSNQCSNVIAPHGDNNVTSVMGYWALAVLTVFGELTGAPWRKLRHLCPTEEELRLRQVKQLAQQHPASEECCYHTRLVGRPDAAPESSPRDEACQRADSSLPSQNSTKKPWSQLSSEIETCPFACDSQVVLKLERQLFLRSLAHHLLCRFWTCQPPHWCEPTPWNRSPSVDR